MRSLAIAQLPYKLDVCSKKHDDPASGEICHTTVLRIHVLPVCFPDTRRWSDVDDGFSQICTCLASSAASMQQPLQHNFRGLQTLNSHSALTVTCRAVCAQLQDFLKRDNLKKQPLLAKGGGYPNPATQSAKSTTRTNTKPKKQTTLNPDSGPQSWRESRSQLEKPRVMFKEWPAFFCISFQMQKFMCCASSAYDSSMHVALGQILVTEVWAWRAALALGTGGIWSRNAATQCHAMPSNAKQCQAMPSNPTIVCKSPLRQSAACQLCAPRHQNPLNAGFQLGFTVSTYNVS